LLISQGEILSKGTFVVQKPLESVSLDPSSTSSGRLSNENSSGIFKADTATSFDISHIDTVDVSSGQIVDVINSQMVTRSNVEKDLDLTSSNHS
jgi:hypothetical protein